MSDDNIVDNRKIATGLVERALGPLVDTAGATVRTKWAEFRNKTTSAFSDYIEREFRRCSLIRTIASDRESTSLLDLYVPLSVSLFLDSKKDEKEGRRHPTSIDHTNLVKLLTAKRDAKFRPTFAAAVNGPAGSGKTFFMRHLFLTLCRTAATNKIPVFIEARDLNDRPKHRISQIIMDTFESAGVVLGKAQVDEALKAGLFIVLIDGIDEIKITLESFYLKEIGTAIDQFQACPFIISGRPSERFYCSRHLRVCNIDPLKQGQIQAIIHRLAFDQDIKDRFLQLVETELAKTHGLS